MAKPDFQAGAGNSRRAADQSAVENGQAPRSDEEISELSDGEGAKDPSAKKIRVDKDWGFSKSRSGLRTETKLGLTFVVVLIGAFGFMVYSKVQEKKNAVQALAKGEGEEEVAEGDGTSPEPLAINGPGSEVRTAENASGNTFMSDGTVTPIEQVPTLAGPEVAATPTPTPTETPATSASDDLESVFGATETAATPPNEPTSEPAVESSPFPEQAAEPEPEVAAKETSEPAAEPPVDAFANDPAFAMPLPETAAAEPPTEPVAAQPAETPGGTVDDPFLTNLDEPAQPESVPVPEETARDAPSLPEASAAATIPVIESPAPSEETAPTEDESQVPSFDSPEFTASTTEPKAEESDEPEVPQVEEFKTDIAEEKAKPAVPETATVASEPEFPSADAQFPSADDQVPSFSATEDPKEAPLAPVADNTMNAKQPEAASTAKEDIELPIADQNFANDTAEQPKAEAGEEHFSEPGTAFPKTIESEPAASVAKSAEPDPFEKDAADQIPSFAQDGGVAPQESMPELANAQPSKHYAVAEADSLWSISQRYYGTPRYHKALYRFNKERIPDPLRMKTGTELELPDPIVLEARYPELFPNRNSVTQASSDGEALGAFFYDDLGNPMYRVGKSDTLSSIAERHLGRSSRWFQIFELNKDQLKNPDNLTIGSVLRMPPDASEGGVVPSVFEVSR